MGTSDKFQPVKRKPNKRRIRNLRNDCSISTSAFSQPYPAQAHSNVEDGWSGDLSVRPLQSGRSMIDIQSSRQGPILMDAPESSQITVWLRSFEQGNQLAAQKLWDCYFQQIFAFAEKRTRGKFQAKVDPEGIAASVFKSLWRGAQDGRLGTVADRNELRALLLSIAKQKVIDRIRREKAQKRGGGRDVLSLSDSAGKKVLSMLPASHSSPCEEVEFREEFQRLLNLLDDEQLQRIAMLKLQGNTNQEITGVAEISIATVNRKLRLIRSKWNLELESTR